MDTLFVTSTLFLIPVNVAAAHGPQNFFLANHVALLAMASWTHHALVHVHGYDATCAYHRIDVALCWSLILHSAALAVTRRARVGFWACLACVVMCYVFGVSANPGYEARGLENWHRHVAHVAMHVSACWGLVVLAATRHRASSTPSRGVAVTDAVSRRRLPASS